MKDGFIKVAAVTPDIEVGNTAYNTEQIIQCISLPEKKMSGFWSSRSFVSQDIPVMISFCKISFWRAVWRVWNRSVQRPGPMTC